MDSQVQGLVTFGVTFDLSMRCTAFFGAENLPCKAGQLCLYAAEWAYCPESRSNAVFTPVVAIGVVPAKEKRHEIT